MKIEHLAILTNDLERLRSFYMQYFNATSNELYRNKRTLFESYFLSFESGSRLEIMKKKYSGPMHLESLGYAHLAMSVGDKEDVDKLVERLVADGYPLLNGPRITGDGYYEAVIQDPDGNYIEITTNV